MKRPRAPAAAGRDLVMEGPDGDGLARRLDHQAGGENRVAGKVKREDPVLLQVHLAADGVAGDLKHAVDLEHRPDRQINGGEIGALIKGIIHEAGEAGGKAGQVTRKGRQMA